MLEAVDILTSGYVCVATIEDFDNEGNVRIHFDGWTNRLSPFPFSSPPIPSPSPSLTPLPLSGYDFWCQRNHPNLAPPGTCKQKGVYLHEPSSRDDAQWIGPEPFNWEGYFKQKKRRAVSKVFFVFFFFGVVVVGGFIFFFYFFFFVLNIISFFFRGFLILITVSGERCPTPPNGRKSKWIVCHSRNMMSLSRFKNYMMSTTSAFLLVIYFLHLFLLIFFLFSFLFFVHRKMKLGAWESRVRSP